MLLPPKDGFGTPKPWLVHSCQELKDKIPEMQKGEVVEVNAEQLRLL